MATRKKKPSDPSSLAGEEPPKNLAANQKSKPLGFGANEAVPSSMATPSGPLTAGNINWGGSGPLGAPGTTSDYPTTNINLYYSGDEWAPVNSPQLVPGIQQQLVQAGLLDPADVRVGKWDDKSAAAYRKVMSLANRDHLDVAQELSQLAQNPPLGDAATPKPAVVYEVTNPTELRESFRQAFIDRTGRVPPQSAMDSFSHSYQMLELQRQKAMNDAQPGSTTTVTSPPSVDTQAKVDIRTKYTAEEQAYTGLQRYNQFFDMLHSIA